MMIIILLPGPDCASGPDLDLHRPPASGSKHASRHACRAGQDPPTCLLGQCPGMTDTDVDIDRHAPQRNTTLRAAPRGPSGLPSAGQRLHRPPPQRTGRERRSPRASREARLLRGLNASPAPSGRLEPAAAPPPRLSQPRFFLRHPLRAPRGPRSRPVLTCEASDATRRDAPRLPAHRPAPAVDTGSDVAARPRPRPRPEAGARLALCGPAAAGHAPSRALV